MGGREAACFFRPSADEIGVSSGGDPSCFIMAAVPSKPMRAIFAITIPAVFSLLLLAAEDPAIKIVHKSSFPVMGIEVRTTNAKEATGDGVIGKQWQRFFQDGVLEKIPNKTDDIVYAVYSDYVDQRNGEYSVLIGTRVAEGSIAPPGLVLKNVPAGRYAVITSDSGPVAEVVVAAWEHVWQMEEKHELGGTRAYRADFELYDQRARDTENSQVDLYIGLK
jgi:predicted transcriptional regulator YdeE